jgi:riboflavin kinase/FMN adenylyltransferase
MVEAYWSLDSVPADFPRSAVTIGNFDGVHRGHQRILEATAERARRAGWQSVALTFDPHPLAIVAPERTPELLTSAAERHKLFGEYGIDATVVLRFTAEVARWSPQEFVERALVERLHAGVVVVGGNFRFGHRHAGDVAELKRLGGRHGFEVVAAEPVLVGGSPVSSSRVRECVREGSVEAARRLLGRPYGMEGEVVRGHGIGAKQTVPTLNLAPQAGIRPANGVYVTSALDPESGDCWRAVTNVGVRPTFNGTEPAIETFVLTDWTGPAPRALRVEFLKRLRDERRFPSAEELKAQILADAAKARRYFRLLETAGKRLTTVSQT